MIEYNTTEGQEPVRLRLNGEQLEKGKEVCANREMEVEGSDRLNKRAYVMGVLR